MNELIENLLKLQSLEFDMPANTGNEARIAKLRAKIPAQILGHYDRLLARGKKGISVIHRQICSACHVQVPRNTVLTLMHGTDIQVCENCGRYLCLPEHVNPTQPPVKIKKAKNKPTALLQTA